MIERIILKKAIIVLSIIILLCAVITIIIMKVNSNSNFTYSTVQTAEMKLAANNNEIIELADLKTVLLYNTVYVPINDTFRLLFGDEYNGELRQIIIHKKTKLDIDFDKDIILVSYYDNNNNEDINNITTVEIEKYEEIKYVPLYLISNISGWSVKVDNNEVYKNNKYMTSLDALKRINENHIIEIIEKDDNNIEEEIYFGQLKGSLWREEAYKRIEKYRKKDYKFNVKNQNGITINNTNVKIEQTNNDFEFATAINAENYNRISKSYFNCLGCENLLKWNFITQKGYDMPKRVVNYAEQNGVLFRGHCLWWDRVHENELKSQIIGLDNNEQENTMVDIYNQYNNNNITIEEANAKIDNLIEKFETIVLTHLYEEVSEFPYINEWDVTNELVDSQYYKNFLYDRKFLTDASFTTINNRGDPKPYNDNYYIFIGKCFDLVRNLKPNAKLVLNEPKISKEVTPVINKIQEHTNNVNSIGFQFHIKNNYQNSPQAYYNKLNDVANQSNIYDITLTEYDNYLDSKINNYTDDENQIRANYLVDTLIMAYSNMNISEFCFWVYNSSRFCDEERQAYEETVYPWLNYTETGTSDENGYSTRLYKGDYTATITLPNGKTKSVDFKVGDNISDEVEVVFETELDKIVISKAPDNTIYYQNGIIDITGGKITAYYDDGTLQEIDMTDSNISFAGYDNTRIGKQNITVIYNNKQATFEIEIIQDPTEEITNIINKINNDNSTILNTNPELLLDPIVQSSYYKTITDNNEVLNNIYEINQNTILLLIQNQINLADTLYNAMFSNKNSELVNTIINIIDVANQYNELFRFTSVEDNTSNEEVRLTINDVISKYNANVNVDISNARDLLENCKILYQNLIDSNDETEIYGLKLRIYSICNIASKIIDYDLMIDLLNNNYYQQEIEQNNENDNTNTDKQDNELNVIDNRIVCKVEQETTMTELLQNYSLDETTIINRNGNIVEGDNLVATGDIFENQGNEYIISILGDINQDGLVDVKDLIQLRKALLEIELLTTIQKHASDINQDGRTNVTDLILIRKIILSQ